MMRRLQILDPDRFAGWDVIPAAVLAECEAADSVLRDAELWAADRREALTREVEAERASAAASAYADGLLQFSAAVDELRRATNALNGRLLDLLRTCLRQALMTIPAEEFLQAAIQPVLRVLPEGQGISIAVHPDRVADLDLALARTGHELPGGLKADVVPDPTLAEGACLVFTRSDVFDVSIEVMTDRLIEAVALHLNEADDENAG
jgi:flagellar biosynthesis/type III secretory pathway protein FliH